MTPSERADEGRRVLVIDDSKVARSILQHDIEAQGFAVDTAEDGMSGLALASAQSYDLVVIDAMMPGLDGFEVCRKLASTRVDGRPMLLIHTNRYKDFQGKQLATAAGADALVMKTPDGRALIDKIVALLR